METKNKKDKPTYVVGIGASAGDVEAIQRFFEHMPENTGLAFVVIQHLLPGSKRTMNQLLTRSMKLNVYTVEDNVELERNAVYVIPQAKNAIVYKDKLRLIEKSSNQALFPINQFFESLAKECGKKAIGVVLSGTGTDGSEGIVALANAGALTLVQDPKTSKYDSMPLSAVETKCVDYILDAPEIARKIGEFLKNPDLFTGQYKEDVPSLNSLYRQIFSYLITQYKVDFSYYKSTTISRRIARRIAAHNLQSLQDYVSLLSSDMAELEELYRDLLVGVTSFFRDAEAFDILSKIVLPALISKTNNENRELRIWVAACSTGEEAYSIAILIKELCEKLALSIEVKIFATDISKEFLAKAGQGSYPKKKLENISKDRLARFFVGKDDKYKIVSEIRNMVVFAPHNILSDPPFTKMDLVCCRNFLIYVQPLVQEKIIDLLHFATKIDGYLFLGSSENIGSPEKGMLAIDSTWKIFQKLVNIHSSRLRPFPIISTNGINNNGLPSSHIESVNNKTLGLQQYAYDQLLSKYIDNGILVDSSREILHIFGDAASYLKYQRGHFNRNLILNVFENLRVPINSCFYQAELEKMTVLCKGIELGDEKNDILNIEVTPLINAVGDVTHYVVVFHENNKSGKRQKIKSVNIDKNSSQIIQDLENVLQQTRDSLQATIEKVETTNEELQSTNEELLASNEELRSTNEELRSTNEELHSVNKELYIVNSEHQNKIAELTDLNTDMDNLLRSTEIRTIFVDSDINIHRFTPAVAALFNFLSTDIGRPMQDFRHNLDFRELTEKTKEVIQTGEMYSKEVKANNRILYLMRIMPYLTKKGNCDGAILTFVDITEIHQAKQILEKNNFDLEEEVRRRAQELTLSETKYSDLYNNAPDMYVSIDPKTAAVIHCNETLVKSLGYQSKEEIVNQPVFNFYAPESRDLAREAFKKFQQHGHVESDDLKLIRKDRTTLPVGVRVSSILDKDGKVLYSMSSWRDLSVEKAYQNEREAHLHSQIVFKEQETLYRTILDAATDGWWDWNLETNADYLSPSFKASFGYSDDEIPNFTGGWKKIIHPEDLLKMNKAFIAHIEKGLPYYLSLRYRHKNGSMRWGLSRGKAIRSEDGKCRRMVGTYTDITDLKLAESKLDLLAHSDSLTGLSNRTAFMDLLKHTVLQADHENHKFCVLYIDLDNFKKINDSMGHAYGDRFLIEVSKRLKNSCRSEDSLARVGGDEFVVVSGFFRESHIPGLIAERILKSFSSSILVGNKEIYSTLSMGLAVYPEAGDNPALLLKNADAAMYQAKNGGKNKFVYYTKELDVTMQRRLDIEEGLRKASDNQELYVVYQPIVNLNQNKVIGFESLMRWKSEKLGEVSPSEFIPIAEETGLISLLTDWLIDTVFPQFSDWKKEYQEAASYISAVNFSVLQLASYDIVEKVVSSCEINNINPSSFLLEITETALLNNIQPVERVIRQLRRHNFGVAIDDFGTGYSSLTALKKLPITHLKIDQSFIQGMGSKGDRAIIKTVLKLGELMNLKVIAEGIEDVSQLNYLRENKCVYAQGFCLHKPMTVKEVDKFLRDQQMLQPIDQLVDAS